MHICIPLLPRSRAYIDGELTRQFQAELHSIQSTELSRIYIMKDQGRGKGDYVPEYSHGYSEDIDVIRDREYPLLKGMHIHLLSLPICTPNQAKKHMLTRTLQIRPIWTMRVRRCIPSH